MPSTAAEEISPPYSPRVRRSGLVVMSILAVCAGAVLGAMAGSRAAGTDEPLPDRPEVLAIARIAWDEREPDEAWVTEEPVENLDSQTEHEDLMGIPGWKQVLFGDATMDKTTGVYWPGPPGWVESYDEPYDWPETLEDNIRRADEAAARLAAAGWDVGRPYTSVVEARQGTLVVSFYYFDRDTPSLDVRRVPPASHPWLMGIGALLGAAAGIGAVAAFARHRRDHPPTAWTGLGVAGLALICVNFAIAVLSLYLSLSYDGHYDDPLWRTARFVPFGLTLNIGLVFLAISVFGLLRQRRRESSARRATG